ncbi:MAG TPA: hypothetical protein VNH64_09690 [Parvularculaceae bacterium]|nr:hypothetical protein [Parvularculaceae bacterium]
MALLKKSLMSAAAAAMALGAALPASADGYHGRYHGGYRGHVGYYGHYGRYGHYGYYPRYYYGSHHYRYHHGLSGGEAALLTVGILGGIVLIDRALEESRASNAYYYNNSYPPTGYYGQSYAPPVYGRADAPPPRDDFYYRRDDRAPAPSDDQSDEDAGGQLLGADSDGGQSAYNYGAAYNDCKAETRQAATDGGLIVSLPAKPQRITPVEDGAAVRFEADFVASTLRGGASGDVRRTMVCEADANGVRYLELI